MLVNSNTKAALVCQSTARRKLFCYAGMLVNNKKKTILVCWYAGQQQQGMLVNCYAGKLINNNNKQAMVVYWYAGQQKQENYAGMLAIWKPHKW